MSITIKNIQELVEAIPQLSDPIIFGDGENLRRVDLATLLQTFVADGISDLSFVISNFNELGTESNGSVSIENVNFSIGQGELRFYKLPILNTDDNTLSLRTYLVIRPSGSYALQTLFNNGFMLELNRESLDPAEFGANTVTYTVANLEEINDANPSFDFSDSEIVYFIQIGSQLFRFIGQNGLYGENDLQLDDNDLQLVSGFQNLQFDQNLSVNSLNGVQNQAVANEFERTNHKGLRSFGQSLTSANQITPLNYSTFVVEENESILIVLNANELAKDFNFQGYVKEGGQLTIIGASGTTIDSNVGSVIEEKHSFRVAKIENENTFKLTDLGDFESQGSTPTLNQVLLQGNETAQPIVYDGLYEVKLFGANDDFGFGAFDKALSFGVDFAGFPFISDATGSVRGFIKFDGFTGDREYTMPLTSGKLIIDADDDDVRYLRRDNEWVNARKKNLVNLSGNFGNYTVEESTDVIRCEQDSEGTLILPSASASNQGTEIKILVERFGEVKTNRDIYELAPDVKFNANTDDIILAGAAFVSLTIISTGSIWQLTNLQTID